MAKDRLSAVPAGYGILLEGDEIWLMLRANTGYEDGKYGLPSGHFEHDEEGTETARRATARELLEEMGVSVEESDLECVHVMYRMFENERVDFFFVARRWEGDPHNAEPAKCEAVERFPLDALPENTIDYVRSAVERWRNGEIYSEFGSFKR